jgi:predicted dehydrogenase
VPGARKLRAAVVGIGGIGKHHARQYRGSPYAELVSVCDCSRECLDAFSTGGVECSRHEDYGEMLEEMRPDVVSVCLPNDLHAPFTITALERGCHVLCEKPLATTVADAERMVAAARRAERLLAVNMSYRFDAHSRFLHALAEKGEFGDVYFAHTVWHRRRGVPRGRTGWFAEKSVAGGGPLIDLGVHRLDLAWWLMGRPEPVRASGATYRTFADHYAEKFGKPVTTEDLAAGLVRFSSGATLSVQASWAGNVPWRERMETRIWGTRAGAVQENLREAYEFTSSVFRTEGGVEVDVTPHAGTLGTPETSVDNCCRAILEGAPLLAPGEDGLVVQRMLEAIYRSAEEGREVDVPLTPASAGVAGPSASLSPPQPPPSIAPAIPPRRPP